MGVVWKRGEDAERLMDGYRDVLGPACRLFCEETDPLRVRRYRFPGPELGLRGPEGGGGRVRVTRLFGVASGVVR